MSRLPLPLYNCIAAVRLNGEVAALAAAGGVLSVPAPSRCLYCTSRGEVHELSNRSTRDGVMVCSRGFCKMEVVVAKCSSCKQWVSRDGRDQQIILLTTTTAATVCWARSMASSAADGMALTTSTTRWLRSVRREMVAGVLPQDCPTRSGRILRNIVLVALKLMVEQLPSSLFSCHHCMDADGRYLCVSADSIWVGFGSGVEHVKFQLVSEAVPKSRQAVRAAYLVRGESVRRVIRDVMKAGKDFKLLARTTRPAELAEVFFFLKHSRPLVFWRPLRPRRPSPSDCPLCMTLRKRGASCWWRRRERWQRTRHETEQRGSGVLLLHTTCQPTSTPRGR